MRASRGLAIVSWLAIITALAPWAAGAAASAGAGPATSPDTQPAAACGSKWVTIASPNGAGALSELQAVAGTSPSDIWAVGDHGPSTATKSLIEHYNGTKWTVSAIPAAGTVLNGVAAISSKNAWAVGTTVTRASDLNTGEGLIEHWDGHSWKVVKAPAALEGAGSSTAFAGIAAVSAKDIWVVGTNQFNPLALHYNGTAWKTFPVDTSGFLGVGHFAAVDAVASDDVWAVGSVFHGDTARLIEHWDGHAWSQVAAAQPVSQGMLVAVDSASSGDVYAVGESINEFLPTAEVQHYNGHAWAAVSAPSPAISSLTALAVKASSSIWAAGFYPKPNGNDSALVMQSSGHAFAQVAVPTPGEASALTLIGGKQLWLVGSTITGTPQHRGSKTFVARRCV